VRPARTGDGTKGVAMARRRRAGLRDGGAGLGGGAMMQLGGAAW